MKDLLTKSGKQIALMIQRGEISSREAVEAHIEHINKVNPAINAVVKYRFDAARKEADIADEKTKMSKAKNLPPYHGVPCTIKEAYALKGMPNTSGHMLRKDVISEGDATAVGRLRRAGAIPLGVTNIPELCMWTESYNHIYGRTRCAYSRWRTSGGSSGGEGAIIGAGGSPFGLGSDIGGSIRFPAFCNGVFGHKPTGGLVPGTGHYPQADGEGRRFATYGVLARRSDDLMPVMRIISGPDGTDESCVPFKLGDPAKVSLKNRHVLYIERGGPFEPDRDLRLAQRACADALQRKGAVIMEKSVKSIKASSMIYLNMLANCLETSFELILGGGKSVTMSLEFIKVLFRASSYTYPSLVLVMLERLNKPMKKLAKKYISMGRTLRDSLISLIGPDGILIYPSYPTPVPFHNKPLATSVFHIGYCGLFNIMEVPSTQVPLGLNKKGLPLGIQIAALHGNDHLTIAAAMELERAFGGWVPPWATGQKKI